MKEELRIQVQNFINGDKEAFEYIFMQEYAKVYTRVKAGIRFDNEEDIEDVVQDTFVKVYEKIDMLKEVEYFESWLMRIAINTAKNKIIKNSRTTFFMEIPDANGETEEDFLENPYTEFQPESEMTRKEIEQILREIFAEIPPCQSMCFQLKEYDGLSYQEISEEMNIPLSSVKNNIFYAKKKIREQIKNRKLYSVAPISFFVWMYRSYVEGAEVTDTAKQMAWRLQEELLKGLSLGISSNTHVAAGMLAEVVVKETGKAIGKFAVAKMAAVVGTVAVLGIVGVGIAQNRQHEEEIIVQEKIYEYEEKSVLSEDEKDIVSEEVPVKIQARNVHGVVKNPEQKDMESLQELIEVTISWVGTKKEDLRDSELFLEIVALEKWNNVIEHIDPRYATESYVIDTETLRIQLFEYYNYDISLEDLEERYINDRGTHQFQYSQDGKFYITSIHGENVLAKFNQMSFDEIGREGDKILYKCTITDSGIQEFYVLTTLFEKDERTYWTLYDWSTNLKDISEEPDGYADLLIENVYVGSASDKSEDLNYSIGGEKHFVTDTPVVHYTIDGREYNKEYNNYYIEGYGCEMSYQLADITGDGKEELIVSVYCIGNVLCETLQETYIYTLNEKWKRLDEILILSSDGCETYVPGMPYNCGVYAIDGGIRLDVSGGEFQEEYKTVYIRYQEGKWTVDSINEHEGWTNMLKE